MPQRRIGSSLSRSSAHIPSAERLAPAVRGRAHGRGAPPRPRTAAIRRARAQHGRATRAERRLPAPDRRAAEPHLHPGEQAREQPPGRRGQPPHRADLAHARSRTMRAGADRARRPAPGGASCRTPMSRRSSTPAKRRSRPDAAAPARRCACRATAGAVITNVAANEPARRDARARMSPKDAHAAVSLYRQGLEAFRGGHDAAAIATFRKFLKTLPAAPLRRQRAVRARRVLLRSQAVSRGGARAAPGRRALPARQQGAGRDAQAGRGPAGARRHARGAQVLEALRPHVSRVTRLRSWPPSGWPRSTTRPRRQVTLGMNGR